jgi:hypothetical protein
MFVPSGVNDTENAAFRLLVWLSGTFEASDDDSGHQNSRVGAHKSQTPHQPQSNHRTQRAVYSMRCAKAKQTQYYGHSIGGGSIDDR